MSDILLTVGVLFVKLSISFNYLIFLSTLTGCKLATCVEILLKHTIDWLR